MFDLQRIVIGDYEFWLLNYNAMKYKVHRFEIRMEDDQLKLKQFLNSLRGEVVSIIPNNKNLGLLQAYGFARRIDFLLIVEKIVN